MQNLFYEKEFYFHAKTENHFHFNGFTLGIALKQMLRGTRKWLRTVAVINLVKIVFAFVPKTNSSFRFLTILYYLNDVPRGGETAFPVADKEIFDQTVRNAVPKTYRIR